MITDHESYFISYKWFMWFQVRETHSSRLKEKILFITMILGSFTEPKPVLSHKLEPSWRSVGNPRNLCFCSASHLDFSLSICFIHFSVCKPISALISSTRWKVGPCVVTDIMYYGIRHWRDTNTLLAPPEL